MGAIKSTVDTLGRRHPYWERAKGDSGEFTSITSNDLFKGRGSVTVKKGEFAKLTGGCTWTKQ